MNDIKLFIYSIQPVIVEGIKYFFQSEQYINICGITNEKKSIKRFLQNKVPHILLIDDTGMEYIEIIKIIEEVKTDIRNFEIIIFTINEDTKYLGMLCNKGIKALVSKKSSKDILLDAVKHVENGQLYIDNYFSYLMLKTKNAAVTYFSRQLMKITKREKEILVMLSEGMRNKDMAEKLFISPRTVEVYKINLSRKLNLQGCPELLRYAVVNREEILRTFLNDEYLSNNPDAC